MAEMSCSCTPGMARLLRLLPSPLSSRFSPTLSTTTSAREATEMATAKPLVLQTIHTYTHIHTHTRSKPYKKRHDEIVERRRNVWGTNILTSNILRWQIEGSLNSL